MNFNTVCRCCLVRPPDKDLKSVYTCQGKTEVYGDMLNECFEIHLPIEPCDSENGICELCIARLRDASDFKHQVLQCQKEFQIKLTTSSDIKGSVFKLLNLKLMVKSCKEMENELMLVINTKFATISVLAKGM
ncbi:unnamed protein product [Euphydryas editha]|uniref:ZAD domain-containing protein n=1 Tax=Euphydryas editha TaxID=104508 RepID=A0AAU9URU5_EUPED|nr:unnamed protein product [Euphydryas editha]